MATQFSFPDEVPQFSFDSASLIRCPECREENPAKAVMCWRCYTPIPDGKPRPDLKLKAHRRKLWRGVMEAVPPMTILFLFGASGWVPREYGTWFLALAIGIPVLSLLVDAVHRLRARFGKKVEQAPSPAAQVPMMLEEHSVAKAEEEPIIRIAKTIFLYALIDGADSVRLSRGSRGVRVMYHVGPEWRDQLKIPGYIWEPLWRYLWSLPTPTTEGIPTEDFTAIFEAKTYRFFLTNETDELNEHLVIDLALDDPVQPNPGP